MYGFDFHDTAQLVSGGGGGILSEATPDDHGNDNQYGFMDMTISKDTLDVTSYSWADTKYGQIILDTDVAKCAGQYREQRFGPTGDWIKYTHYQGQCVMYFDGRKHASQKGWVLKDGQEVDKNLPWYCAGGDANNLVQTEGDWTVNEALGNVSRCRLTFPVGNLIPKLHKVIKKAYPADRPLPGCKGGTLTACQDLCAEDAQKNNDVAALLACMRTCTDKCVNSGDTNDYPEPEPDPAPAPAPQPSSASCASKCGQPYTPGLPCQCNADCKTYSSCCADYDNQCQRAIV